jgi:hypothetical protein
MPYIVGEKGPELFMPRTNGNILKTTALEKLTRERNDLKNREMESGSGKNYQYYITINNPVPETASDSISRRMKAMSTSGQFG